MIAIGAVHAVSPPLAPETWRVSTDSIQNLRALSSYPELEEARLRDFEANFGSWAISLLPRPSTVRQGPELSSATARVEAATQSVRSELDIYASYGPNWDGYGAKPFDQHVLKLSRALVARISGFLLREQVVPEDFVPGPGADGSVDIELVRGTKRLLLNVAGPAAYTAYREEGSIGLDDVEIQTRDVAALEKRLLWLAG